MLNHLRYKILFHSFKSKEGHIGSCFSILEILYVITSDYVKNKKAQFILSKGHAALSLYVVYNHFKIISDEDLNSFSKFNSKLGGHPDSKKINDFIFSTGSLGHGLPTSIGLALSYKLQKKKNKIICLVGDQELLEGTTWESLFFIQNYAIDNLVLIIDKNNSDFRSTQILGLYKKISTFTRNIYKIDGHNISQIRSTLNKIYSKKEFAVIICKTIKGKGIKEMQNNPEWHHKFPNYEQLQKYKKRLLNEK